MNQRITHKQKRRTLEVRAAAAADQEGVARERHRTIVEHEGDTAVGVPGGGAHLEVVAPEAILGLCF